MMKHIGRIGLTILLSVSVAMITSCGSRNKVSRKESPANLQRYAMTFKDVKKAAEKGDADAQYALGFMYYYGKQVGRDMTQAKQWIRKAAEQGQTRAITALKLMGEKTPVAKTTHLAQNKTKSAQKTVTKVAAKKKSMHPDPSPKIAKAKTTKVHKAVKVAKVSKPKTVAKAKPTVKTVTVASATSVTKNNFKAKVKKMEKRLMKKHDDHFTLQLLGSHNIAQIESVIERNHLANNASIYHTYFKGKDWYVLIYGDYKTPDDALAAIDRLPPTAQQLKPWVKPYASVKVGIRTKGPMHT